MPEHTSVATARLLAEVWWLKTNGPVTIQRFAKHFHRTKRQIQRDLDVIGEAKDSMPGESFELDWDQLNRGIVAVQGMKDLIQQPALTINEAVHILFGLRVMAPLLDQTAREHASSLILTLAPLVEGFDAFRLVFVDVHDFAPAVILAEKAISSHKQLLFDYQDRHGHMSRRRVDPVRVEHRMDGWYLNAWCYLAGGPRTFRLSAMSHVALSDQQLQLHPEDAPHFPEVLELTVTNAARWLVDDHVAELVSNEGDFMRLRLPVWDQRWVLGLLFELADQVTELPQVWQDRRRARAAEIRNVWEQVDRL